VTFACERLRFHLRAEDPLYFAPGSPANTLRGGFGTVLARIDPVAYARLFEPPAAGPSGLADPPRPFVFRAAHLDGRRIAPGERFHFDAHLFDLRDSAAPHFARAFAELGREGFGPGRGRAELVEVERPEAPAIRLDEPEPASGVLVRFLTPTELKSGQGLAERPEFEILFARLRDRIAALMALYGGGAPAIDFREMGRRAGAVRLVRCNLRRVAARRRSSRTGQEHPLGGFAGEAEYQGPLGEFLPYLRAGRWTGVGRQTVWGKGEIDVVAQPRL
jgi:hypothetical protein